MLGVLNGWCAANVLAQHAAGAAATTSRGTVSAHVGTSNVDTSNVGPSNVGATWRIIGGATNFGEADAANVGEAGCIFVVGGAGVGADRARCRGVTASTAALDDRGRQAAAPGSSDDGAPEQP